MSSTTFGRPMLASALGACLCAMAFVPAAAEVKLPSDRGVAFGDHLTNEVRITDMPSASNGAKVPTALPADTAASRAQRGDLTSIDRSAVHAEGSGAVSRMAVGTIGDVTVGGDLANTVTIGSSINIAIGDGARACTEIGTLGLVDFCE